jgi:hypothetical protein
MLVPQGIKKMVNVAEKQIGNVGTQVTDAKNYVFSMGRRTMTSISTTSGSTTSEMTTHSETMVHPSHNSSLMANTLLWAHLIPPMPLIASTMYRHYAKGNSLPQAELHCFLIIHCRSTCKIMDTIYGYYNCCDSRLFEPIE